VQHPASTARPGCKNYKFGPLVGSGSGLKGAVLVQPQHSAKQSEEDGSTQPHLLRLRLGGEMSSKQIANLMFAIWLGLALGFLFTMAVALVMSKL
jgi:hypothetical protein